MSKLQYTTRRMVIAMMFNCSNNRYAVASFHTIDGLYHVRGGDNRDPIRGGGDFHVAKLKPIEAAGAVMQAMDMPHDEDTWCSILNDLHINKQITIRQYGERCNKWI